MRIPVSYQRQKRIELEPYDGMQAVYMAAPSGKVGLAKATPDKDHVVHLGELEEFENLSKNRLDPYLIKKGNVLTISNNESVKKRVMALVNTWHSGEFEVNARNATGLVDGAIDDGFLNVGSFRDVVYEWLDWQRQQEEGDIAIVGALALLLHAPKARRTERNYKVEV